MRVHTRKHYIQSYKVVIKGCYHQTEGGRVKERVTEEYQRGKNKSLFLTKNTFKHKSTNGLFPNIYVRE